MTRISNTKRGLSALGVASLLVAGLGVAASAAEVGPDQPGAPTEGTLTIHKYAGAPVDGAGNDGRLLTGNELEDREALGGVTFEVQRVGIIESGTCVDELSLDEPADWDFVPTTEVPSFGSNEGDLCATGSPATLTTDNFGTAEFTGNLGLYYVTETDPGDHPVVEQAAPFYVTLPMPTVADDPLDYDWNYDVHVYPKNQLAGEPTKTITERPDDLTVGSNVTWNLSATVPTLNDAATFTEASIKDQLNDRLGYVSSIVRVGDTVVYSDVAGVEVPTAGLVDRTGEATWTFTEEGLAILGENQGAAVTVELVTKVTGGAGEITNGGDDPDNNPAEFSFNGVSRPTPLAYTYWGQLKITKVDQSDNARKLSGAEFAVHEAADEATECPAEPTGDAVSTGTSGEDGVVTWTHADSDTRSPLNLWVANSNTELTDPSKAYCVYETKAPAGYTATGPQLVNITSGDLTTANDLNWEDPQREGPDLPLTGASGTLALTAGGLLLMFLGVTSVVLTSKRRQKNQA